jgi:hypothetical protein
VSIDSRWIALGLVLVPVLAAGAFSDPEPRVPAAPRPAEKAPPPAPAGAAAPTGDPAADRAKLIRRLDALLDAGHGREGTKTGPASTPKSRPEYTANEPGKGIDQVREGINLFRDGYFDAAQRTFFNIEPSSLSPEDRAFVKYMRACSLRRMGKTAEAQPLYVEVANNPDDEFLASCAMSQLALLRSNQELEAQLELLRSRVKSK